MTKLSYNDSRLGNIPKTQEEFKQDKLSGSSTVSLPCFLGYHALKHTDKDFVVVYIDDAYYSIYNYKVVNGRIRLEGFSEKVAHNLNEILRPYISEQTICWWKSVFFRRNGLISYDSKYDTLRVSEQCDTVFSVLIESVRNELQRWDQMTPSSNMFVIDDYSGATIIPYIWQNQFKDIQSVEPLVLDSDITDETDIACLQLPQIGQGRIKVNGGLALDCFTNEKVRVSLPIADEVLAGTVYDNKTWGDVIPNNMAKNYEYSSCSFAYLDMNLEVDVYGNAYLVCSDIFGKKKITEITQ